MSITVTPYLRNVLHADAAMSGAAGLVMLLGAPVLAPLLELPAGLLRWAGIVLIPWTVLLVILGRRETMSRTMLFDVIAINALWLAASFGILLAGAVSPNLLGYGFVVAQALAVGVLAELQFMAYRRSGREVTA
jgi:hypothetical protein